MKLLQELTGMLAEGKVSGYKMYQNHDGTWYVEDENENVVLRNASEGEAEHAVWSGNKKLEQGIAEAGPFSYGKPPRKGSVAWQAAQNRKEQDKKTPAIEPKDQQVGVAKVTKDVKEGSDNTVHFEIDSENAYNHVMETFGSVIGWDDGAMVAPREYWGDIQELADSAGGQAEEVGGERYAKD